MKKWKYCLFACVASGFLFIGVDQIKAEETTPVEQSIEEHVSDIENMNDISVSTGTGDTENVDENTTNENNTKQQDITYKSNVQEDGWESESHLNGELSGTQGKSKRLEQIQISLPNHNDAVQYQVHVQDLGWMNYVSGGTIVGVENHRIEAIRIQLLHDFANKYNVIYRTHVQKLGWLDWVMNNSVSGTVGKSLRIEAIQILLEERPETSTTIDSEKMLTYDSHVQGIGWQTAVNDGQVAGTTGQSKRMEALHLSLNNPNTAGHILYQVHVAQKGWLDWVSDGQMAGTTGQSRQIEAIRILLSGDIAEKYDVYYRVHAQSYGWLSWISNGLAAGTTGLSKRIEAFEVYLLEKNQPNQLNLDHGKPCYIDKEKVVDAHGNIIHMEMANQFVDILKQSNWSLVNSYNWVVKNIRYKGMTTDASLGSDYFATYGIRNKRGNCYVYAAIAYNFGKILGFDIHQVTGHHLTGNGHKPAHSWCDIYLNNKTYMLDPTIEKELFCNGFMIQYGEPKTLKILDHVQMN
jgi:uncharacterized protein YjdB